MTNAYNVESYANHHIDDCEHKGQKMPSEILSTCIPFTNFSGDVTHYKIILARGSGGH